MIIPAENFRPSEDNPDVLEVPCGACLREINVEGEYVEVFVEKFYEELDEWFPLHRHCYESSLRHVISAMETR